REPQRFGGQFDACVVSSCASERYCCGSYTTSDFEHLLSLPFFKFGEHRDVRFNQIFAGLDLVEILPATDWRNGVSNVTRPSIPIFPNGIYFCVPSGFHTMRTRTISPLIQDLGV